MGTYNENKSGNNFGGKKNHIYLMSILAEIVLHMCKLVRVLKVKTCNIYTGWLFVLKLKDFSFKQKQEL